MITSILIRFGKPEENRTGHIDGGICTHNNADKQRKGKIVNNATAKEVQGQDHKERGSRSEQRTAQGLVDTGIDRLTQIFGRLGMDIFPDTVKDDNGVIERISQDGQKCGYDGQIEILIQQRKIPTVIIRSWISATTAPSA